MTREWRGRPEHDPDVRDYKDAGGGGCLGSAARALLTLTGLTATVAGAGIAVITWPGYQTCQSAVGQVAQLVQPDLIQQCGQAEELLAGAAVALLLGVPAAVGGFIMVRRA